MKSFFDFIGRTETSRGARRWSWTILKMNSILPYLTKSLWTDPQAFYY
ncbi:hypothetical protein [Mesobacillus sp.]